MRAKVCQEYLTLGAAFANAATIQSSEVNPDSWVACRGPESIHAALAKSVPNITRGSDGSLGCKGAMSEFELNKFLKSSGYKPHRIRNRIKGATNMWTKGVFRWKNRRWVDICNADELQHMKAKLADMKLESQSIEIAEHRLIEFLSEVISDQTTRESMGNASPHEILTHEDHELEAIAKDPSSMQKLPSCCVHRQRIPRSQFTATNRCGAKFAFE